VTRGPGGMCSAWRFSSTSPVGLRSGNPSASDSSLVYEAPAPVFPRLEGLDDRMAGALEVLSRVLIGGGIAAAHMAACEAQAEMHPAGADPQAILATGGARGHSADCFEMRIGHSLVRFRSWVSGGGAPKLTATLRDTTTLQLAEPDRLHSRAPEADECASLRGSFATAIGASPVHRLRIPFVGSRKTFLMLPPWARPSLLDRRELSAEGACRNRPDPRIRASHVTRASTVMSSGARDSRRPWPGQLLALAC